MFVIYNSNITTHALYNVKAPKNNEFQRMSSSYLSITGMAPFWQQIAYAVTIVKRNVAILL